MTGPEITNFDVVEFEHMNREGGNDYSMYDVGCEPDGRFTQGSVILRIHTVPRTAGKHRPGGLNWFDRGSNNGGCN